MKLIILGPPGAGKDTQAKLLSKRLKLKIVSSEVLKKEVRKGTKLGKIFKTYIDRGDLVPSDLMLKLLKRELPKDNFILDGAPRDIDEAKKLRTLFEPDYIIWLTAPHSILLKRLLGRAKIEGRKDDNLKTIKHRFAVYRKRTLPVVKYYKNKIVKIVSNGHPEEIDKEIRKKLGCI